MMKKRMRDMPGYRVGETWHRAFLSCPCIRKEMPVAAGPQMESRISRKRGLWLVVCVNKRSRSFMTPASSIAKRVLRGNKDIKQEYS